MTILPQQAGWGVCGAVRLLAGAQIMHSMHCHAAMPAACIATPGTLLQRGVHQPACSLSAAAPAAAATDQLQVPASPTLLYNDGSTSYSLSGSLGSCSGDPGPSPAPAPAPPSSSDGGSSTAAVVGGAVGGAVAAAGAPAAPVPLRALTRRYWRGRIPSRGQCVLCVEQADPQAFTCSLASLVVQAWPFWRGGGAGGAGGSRQPAGVPAPRPAPPLLAP